MSREVQWDNYVKGTLSDGTSAFTTDTRDCALLKPRHHHHHKHQQNASSNDTDAEDKEAHEHCVEYADVHVKNSTFEDQYDAAMKTRELLTPFIWRLDYDWSTIPQAPAMLGLEENLIELFHRRSRTCKDYTLTPSDAIANATHRLTKALKLKQEGYTTLLLKRRKSHDVCDTSVENVVGYVNCTLHTLASDHRSSPIVFYTDETDSDYLTQLQDALMEACNCSVYHGDAVISAMVPEASDPYNGGAAFAIEIGLIIRMQARYELRLDSTHCQNCESSLPIKTCESSGVTTSCSLFDYVVRGQRHLEAFMETQAVIEEGGSLDAERSACPAEI
jgi:hypothetical protein